MPTPLPETRNIRTLVLSDQSLVQAELCHFLEFYPDITLLEVPARDKCSTTELVRKLQPDVVLLDGTAPGDGNLATLTKLSTECPQLPLVLLAAQDSKTYVLQAFKAGAAGYVLSMTGEVYIVNAIREVHAGQLYFCPRIRKLFIELYGGSTPEVMKLNHENNMQSRKNLPSNKGEPP